MIKVILFKKVLKFENHKVINKFIEKNEKEFSGFEGPVLRRGGGR